MSRVKLFIIPYAGASTAVFNNWKQFVPDSIELVLIELSGKGRRIREPLYTSIEEATNDVFDIISQQLDGVPFVIFGHSLGSTIAFETVKKLEHSDIGAPLHLILSGRKAPHLSKDGLILHKLPEHEFKSEIIKLGGIPEELIRNEELMDLFLPIIMTDIRINELYIPGEEVIQCPMTVMGGTGDRLVDYNGLKQWLRYTKNDFNILRFPGGHFFLHENEQRIVTAINAIALKYAPSNR